MVEPPQDAEQPCRTGLTRTIILGGRCTEQCPERGFPQTLKTGGVEWARTHLARTKVCDLLRAGSRQPVGRWAGWPVRLEASSDRLESEPTGLRVGETDPEANVVVP